MKIRILGSASRDLIEGYSFYERQAEGVGSYFLDSLYSDIDSLIITAGMHSVHFDKHQRNRDYAAAAPKARESRGDMRG